MEIIITQLIGGLGNQFFQYAIARAIAINNSLELKFDTSEFEEYKIRNYELDNFNIQESFATQEQINQLKQKKIFKKTYLKEKKASGALQLINRSVIRL